MLDSSYSALGLNASLVAIIKEHLKTDFNFNLNLFLIWSKNINDVYYHQFWNAIKFYALIIYNIQVCFDPELILISGGISHHKIVIKAILKKLNKIKSKTLDSKIIFKIKVAKFKNNANLVGASFLKKFW